MIDANVAAEYVLPERGEEAAQAVLTNAQVQRFAPTLIRLEVTSAILRCHRQGRMAESGVRTAMEQWHEVPASRRLQLTANHEILKTASDLALRASRALYDCLYVAVAQKQDARLLTAGRTLYRRLASHFPNIALLEPLS